MGLFDGVSLKSAIRDVTNVVGAFTGAAPIQDKQETKIIAAPTRTSETPVPYVPPSEGENYLADVIRTLPVFNQPQEQKISGEKVVNMYENGPMQAGVVLPFAQQVGRTIGRSIFGTGTGGAIGGAVTGYGVGSMLAGNGDACGCEAKPFVRFDKCGRPIITRAMQAKAKDMVQNCGMEAAAQMLGIDIQLLGAIAFKKFKPRAKGISGAQLKTAKRVARQMHASQKAFKAACNGR